MNLQQFGTIETGFGQAYAMLCIDKDKPNELMVHWWGDGIESHGCCFIAEPLNGELHLKPGRLYRESPTGSPFDPLESELTEVERRFQQNLKAVLRLKDGCYSGEWIP